MSHILKFYFPTLEYDKRNIWSLLSFIAPTCNSGGSLFKMSGTYLNSK